MKKGVSASPPGIGKCYLLQKGRGFYETKRNSFRFAEGSGGQGVPLSWNQSHSSTPAPEFSQSDPPGAVHLQPSGSDKRSEKHLISILKIAFSVAFLEAFVRKAALKK